MSELSESLAKKVVEHGWTSGQEQVFRGILASEVVSVLKGQGDQSLPKKDRVAQAVQGAMEALSTLGMPASQAVMEVIQAMSEAAEQMGLDPEFLVRWCIPGLAVGMRSESQSTKDQTRELLEKNSRGLGEAYKKLCAENHLKPSPPPAPVATAA